MSRQKSKNMSNVMLASLSHSAMNYLQAYSDESLPLVTSGFALTSQARAISSKLMLLTVVLVLALSSFQYSQRITSYRSKLISYPRNSSSKSARSILPESVLSRYLKSFLISFSSKFTLQSWRALAKSRIVMVYPLELNAEMSDLVICLTLKLLLFASCFLTSMMSYSGTRD